MVIDDNVWNRREVNFYQIGVTKCKLECPYIRTVPSSTMALH